MIHTIIKYINGNGLLCESDKVVVGFSGGADSAVLLYILNKLGYHCIAAHCNFHLRGDESNRDAKFSETFAKNLNIKFLQKEFDTLAFAKEQKISLEMAARDLRYRWFEEIRLSENAVAIAVAHHSDDSIETMLLNLIRGTGIRGLTGIHSHNGLIIRPLLCVSKAEILRYAQTEKIAYITDSTNFQDEFTRNKIRRQLLPLLETLNPSVKASLQATMNNLSETAKIYEAHIETARKIVFDEKKGKINIPLLKTFPSPKTVLFEILNGFGFSRDIVAAIYDSIDSQSGKTFYAPAMRLVKNRNAFLLSPLKTENNNEYLIEENCNNIDTPLKMTVSCVDYDNSLIISKENNVATLDRNKLQFPLVLRRWRAGDKFIPFGMNGFQKLSDFFNNNKISLPEKEEIWVLQSAEDIVWIVNHRIDNRFKIEKSTTKTVILETIKQLNEIGGCKYS
ncbi:MAG: tRNA lysidine(34) synthetase TilS [Dysgonamonadaceae bacterium]|jgi:tRNA(Ile)-lysidine synthase|nr:tRNA lysidine(34) synthetase TilS [Dysgonamonadaceae bacterium]